MNITNIYTFNPQITSQRTIECCREMRILAMSELDR